MSKQCAICGDKIQMMSEYSLSKDHRNVKICFKCYEYVATAMKGNGTAVERLKSRYKEDISEKVSVFIESMGNGAKKSESNKEKKPDEFMELMSNDISKEKVSEKPAAPYNIIKLDNLVTIYNFEDIKQAIKDTISNKIIKAFVKI